LLIAIVSPARAIEVLIENHFDAAIVVDLLVAEDCVGLALSVKGTGGDWLSMKP
jgi:hypothetical protein